MRVLQGRFTVRRMMVAVLGLALVFGGVAYGLRKAENWLVVENRSGQTLASLQISLSNAGHVAVVENLPEGGTETASFRIRGDDSFVLKGSLADGTKVGGGFGYVTNGDYGVRPRFVIRQGGRVEFNQ